MSPYSTYWNSVLAQPNTMEYPRYWLDTSQLPANSWLVIPNVSLYVGRWANVTTAVAGKTPPRSSSLFYYFRLNHNQDQHDNYYFRLNLYTEVRGSSTGICGNPIRKENTKENFMFERIWDVVGGLCDIYFRERKKGVEGFAYGNSNWIIVVIICR